MTHCFAVSTRRFDIQIEIADTNAIIDHWRALTGKPTFEVCAAHLSSMQA